MSEPHRRRRGSSRPAGPPPAASEPDEIGARSSKPTPQKQGSRPGRSGGGAARDSERGWRDLAGNSPSQVGLSAALRARDVARPSEDQLAAAERDVVIVRRQWAPPT